MNLPPDRPIVKLSVEISTMSSGELSLTSLAQASESTISSHYYANLKNFGANMKITLATHRFLAYFDSFVKTGNDVWNRVFGRKKLRDITHVMR